MFRVLRDLANDAVMFLRSTFHSRTALIAENLFLRKQLTFYREHQVRPRRLTNAARLVDRLASPDVPIVVEVEVSSRRSSAVAGRPSANDRANGA